LGGPESLGFVVDVRERLKGARGAVVARLVVGAADGERGGARRPVLVEDDDPSVRIPEELEREKAEKGALPGAGRADDQRMADVLDREVEAKRGVAAGAAMDVGGADAGHLPEVTVAVGAGPHRRDGNELRQVDRVENRAPNVRVNVPG
jgi:hypothetical protein